MFNSLHGKITGKFPQKLFIETNGIEWDVFVPDTSLDSLPNVGENARVFVWLQHTDSSMTLFGFASEADRALFFDLTKVDGVGPKSAVKIMSSVSRSRLVSALDSEDLASLEKIPGLGKKTAQKMLLALKGKLSLAENSSSQKKKSAFPAVLDALLGMGYDKKTSETALEKIVADFSTDDSFEKKSEKEKEDAVFRRAIVEMAQ